MLQLQRLAEQVGADFLPVEPGAAPPRIAATALDAARRGVYDVLIVDTAGRLHVDAELMQEVREIDAAVAPHERLFVVDAMAGQDAVNAAQAFGAALQLTGVILTKADGDARGGAALSVREITGSPMLFVGTGEKSEALEPFDPDRMARRILGMGDVVALVEEVRRNVDVEEAQRLAQEGRQGQGFRLQRPEVAAAAAAEDGRHGQPARQAARRCRGGAEAGAGRGRQGAEAPDRADRFHDAARAPPARDHRRFAPSPHRSRGGHAGAGRQPAAEAAPGDAEDDEAAGQRQAAADDGRDGGQTGRRRAVPTGR